MNNLNSILIEGNLVRDAELRHTPKGVAVLTMSIASNRYYKSDDKGFDKEVSFFDIEIWGLLGETCFEKVKKGRGVRVVGRLKQNRWQSADGKTHSRITIAAEHCEFRPQFKKEKTENLSESFIETLEEKTEELDFVNEDETVSAVA